MAGKEEKYQLFKYVIVGDTDVGKSTLLLRYVTGKFNENYKSTIGVDYRFKLIQHGLRNINLQIWDTAGQQRYRTITNTYYRGAHGVFLVYDITNEQSLESIKNFWLGEVQNYGQPDVIVMLVGNKIDLEENRVVNTNSTKEYASKQFMQFSEISAKNGSNIDNIFTKMTNNVIEKMQKKNIYSNSITLCDQHRPLKQKPCGIC